MRPVRLSPNQPSSISPMKKTAPLFHPCQNAQVKKSSICGYGSHLSSQPHRRVSFVPPPSPSTKQRSHTRNVARVDNVPYVCLTYIQQQYRRIISTVPGIQFSQQRRISASLLSTYVEQRAPPPCPRSARFVLSFPVGLLVEEQQRSHLHAIRDRHCILLFPEHSGSRFPLHHAV